MAKRLEALRGMEDILPGEVEKWQWLEGRARLFFESRGYKEIRTPILELTELFTRSVGESSDIVHKEMFSFEDRGERNITLRPEMTASIARAVIEHGLLKTNKSLRFYYIGPMFRAERPQAGRKRQFNQIGIEIINEASIEADLEVIEALYSFLIFLGVKNLKLRINDLGSVEQQRETANKLREYFSNNKTKLCSDCQWRLGKNVLRIFDCKNLACQSVIDCVQWDSIAPLSFEFMKLKEKLEQRNYSFEIKRRLVRGLDYYNGTVFEVSAEGLGAQDALAGGGRYDRLYEDLGEKATPSTGFSIGLERLLMVLEKNGISFKKENEIAVYLAPILGSDSYQEAKRLRNAYFHQVYDVVGEKDSWKKNYLNHYIKNLFPSDSSDLINSNKNKDTGADIRSFLILLSMMFRLDGYQAVVGSNLDLKGHLKKANNMGARYVVMLGEKELEMGKLRVKPMLEPTIPEQDLNLLEAVQLVEGKKNS